MTTFRAKTHNVAAPVIATSVQAILQGANPVYQGTTSSINGGAFNTSCSLSLPGSASNGDLLLAWGCHSGDSTQCNISEAGWTVLTRPAPGNLNGLIAYRIKNGTEGATITWTGSNSYWTVACSYFTGVNTTTPILSFVKTEHTTPANSFETGAASLAGATQPILGLGFWFTDRDVGGSTPFFWESDAANTAMLVSIDTISAETMIGMGTGAVPFDSMLDFSGVTIY